MEGKDNGRLSATLYLRTKLSEISLKFAPLSTGKAKFLSFLFICWYMLYETLTEKWPF